MDRTYKLPHPVRTSCTEALENEVKLMNHLFDEILAKESIGKCHLEYITTLFRMNHPKLVNSELTTHENNIMIATMSMPYKYRRDEGTIFTTSNEVDRLLEETDIGDDIPISYLRPPFRTCYIEFTEDRSSTLHVYNNGTGEHILEGVYISETEVAPDTPEMARFDGRNDVDTSKDLRVLELMFTGSPLGKSNNMDDALRVQSFYIQDNAKTINNELREVEKLYGDDDDFAGDLHYLSKTLTHMAKVLLFMNCKQYRDTAFNERLEIERKIESLKSSAKISKYHKKLRKSYNRIIIKPENNLSYKSDDSQEHESDVKNKKAHWRKGHFRMQPYGPGAKKRKILFIEPTIVGGVYAGKKSYTAKPKVAQA